MKKNDLPGNGKAKTKMLFVFPRGIYAVKTKVSQFLMENSLTGFVNGEIIKDWIPDQWSDFGFWMKKWKEMKTNFQRYLMLPKTAV